MECFGLNVSDFELGLGSVVKAINPEQDLARRVLTEHLEVCSVKEKG